MSVDASRPLMNDRTDFDSVLFQYTGKIRAGKLTALVGVGTQEPNLRLELLAKKVGFVVRIQPADATLRLEHLMWSICK
jgi:hypothetical protein